MDLKDYRDQIDKIDDEILRLFSERMDVARQIAIYKKEHDLPVLNTEREHEKLLDISQKVGEDIRKYAFALYAIMFEVSRKYQEDIIA